jgi:hypothetical protein
MASNAGKRLELLKKQLAELQAKDKGFHFVVIQPGETESERVEALESAGIISPGDEYQPITIPWRVNPLKGTTYIPEGSLVDPLADPLGSGEYEVGGVGYGSGLRATASNPAPDPLPTHEQQERWKRHEAEITRLGQRYSGQELDRQLDKWR